jgi:outer membrane immunogenic protein
MTRNSLKLSNKTLFACAAAAVLFGAGSAHAGSPPPGGTGFYLGINGGYGWSQNKVTGTPYQSFAPSGNGTAVPAFSHNQGPAGSITGIQGGYNYQINNWVLGGEGDFDLSGMNGAAARVLPDPLRGAGGLASDGFMSHESIDWLANLRARLGYSMDDGLLYATGGLGFEGVQDKYLLSTDVAPSTFSVSTASNANRTEIGWVAGVGYEYGIAPGWTMRGEYLHYGFGSGKSRVVPEVPCRATGSACGAIVNGGKNDIDTLDIGLDYNFGAGAMGQPGYESASGSVAAVSWTGFYAGINGGYGWSKNQVTATPYQNFAPSGSGPVIPAFSHSQGMSGAVTGIQGGYDDQINNYVVGGEGDFDLAGINGATARVLRDPLQGSSGTASDGFMSQESVNWLASLRARLGYTLNNGVLYATGGLGFEGIQDKYLLSTDAADSSVYSTSTVSSANRVVVGWVAGAGYEYPIAPQWTLRGEYLHYGFTPNAVKAVPSVPCSGFSASSACGAYVASKNSSIDMLQLGLTYTFGDGFLGRSEDNH